jgi:hypothetical protein
MYVASAFAFSSSFSFFYHVSHRELRDHDYTENPEKRERAFRLLSKSKSFIVRAKTDESKNEWFQLLHETALYVNS